MLLMRNTKSFKEYLSETPIGDYKTFGDFSKRYNKLTEAPLPDDWDKSKFDGSKRTSFAEQLAYAKERAKRVGGGSSRVAFKIEFQGRPTILKIAKNGKGLAQNEQEAQMLSDWYAKGLEIMIPMIDYDEDSSRPTWLHVELATKASDSDFVRVCGGNLMDLMSYASQYIGKKNMFHGDPTKVEDADDNEFVNSFVDLCGNYDHPLGDYSRLANWGIYKGQPVLIDLGLSKDVMKTHYS